MNFTLEQFGIDRLNPVERVGLIQLIWDSLPDDTVIPPSKADQQELARRIAAADADPGAAEPWEQVLARLSRDA